MTAPAFPSPAAAPPDKQLLRALAGQGGGPVPLWLMRQAGRYLPEYRALRARARSFLDFCLTPEWAVEATLQPLARFGLDAAIIFSDILVVPHALGQEVAFVEGEGPRLGPCPDLAAVPEDFEARLQPCYEALTRTRAALPQNAALIGFAGAPWTLACYMLQGRGDGTFVQARERAARAPDGFARLIDLLAAAVARHLIAQIRAGAEAVQIFDSWAGLLAAEDFARWVIAPTQRLVAEVRRACPGVPLIGFPRGAGEMTARYAQQTGVDGLSLDPAAPLRDLRRTLGDKIALQGNLDPAHLLAGGAALEDNAKRILAAAGDFPFIFNLGHGVIKETPPAHVAQLVRIVREWRR